ncbi:MAG TPA: Gfo/Idh/MocA family oxidoreductase [Thermoanaerobaculia bacterium]|nr:Gfo/Idh/MocA family oxidoreductase [Thermoanaerobaculia bacterium]
MALVRTAILGLGNVAERIHIPACRTVDEIVIVAASEPRPDRRNEMRSRFDLPAVYEDSRELIERERPDLVIVGTPPDSHKDLCLLALRGGADVLCEKPFMPSVPEADEVIAEARGQGRLLAVNTQYRHMEIYRAARDRLAAGEFGRLFFLQCWQQMFHPPLRETLEWRSRLKRSTLFEFGTHAIDLVCSFFGALPEAVTAHIPRVRPELDSDVLVQMTLRFPEERLATLAFNRVSHAPERYLEMRLDCENASLRLSLGGVACAGFEITRHDGKRRLNPRFSYVRGGEARIEAGGSSRLLAREPRPAFAAATAAHLRELLRWRQSPNGDRWASAEHARAVLRVALAGYESAEKGCTVAL